MSRKGNMTLKKEVIIGNFVNDLRSGLDVSSLMEKHGLSLYGFLEALDRLIESNAISHTELQSILPLERQEITCRELRTFPRSPVDKPVLVCDMTDPAPEGIIRNISRGGLLIEGISSEVGETKRLLISPKGFPSITSFALGAECRWTFTKPETGECYGGFRILRISKMGLSEIEKLLTLLSSVETKQGIKTLKSSLASRSTSRAAEVSIKAIQGENVRSNSVTDSGSFDIGIRIKQFERLLESIPIPSFLVDEGHHIVVANEYCHTLGFPPERFIGVPLLNFFPTDRQIVKSFFEQVVVQRKSVIFVGAMQVENRKIFAKISFRSIRFGAQRFILTVVEDVTNEIKGSIGTTSEVDRLTRAYEEALKLLADSEISLLHKTEAVRVVMRALDDRIKEEREKLAIGLDLNVKPIVSKLKAENGLSEYGKALVQILEHALEDAAPAVQHRTSHLYSVLSPRQMEVCNLVLAGHRTKDIANMLGVSVETVTTHRTQIRKKLGLGDSKQNLSTWLRARLVKLGQAHEAPPK
jgi:PAS domain S-box-containing protein